MTGVHSPTLSGSSQLDAYRPLRPPTLLVASHELGGISMTISAYESLLLRGYDVDGALVFREDYYRNFDYFARWFAERSIPLAVVDRPPALDADKQRDVQNMHAYYDSIAAAGQDGQVGHSLQSLVQRLQRKHESRVEKLESAAQRSLDTVWWPFAQHKTITKDQVAFIDSAKGDMFTSVTDARRGSTKAILEPRFDGSASWWTQCLGHAHPELALAAANAAGRYGHVIFASTAHEPGLELSERLLTSVGAGWASRVFFSDNGSTGMEVALKMALRAVAIAGKLERHEARHLAVLGLKGSYHGDTIGAMDACEDNLFNERVDWYEGKGFWLDPPTVLTSRGRVTVKHGDRTVEYDDMAALFDLNARLQSDPLAEHYRVSIESTLKAHMKTTRSKFGALVLEPVIMGAGGMFLVDPLFQRVLIDLVRTNRDLFPLSSDQNAGWQGLPVIFDEVFVGLRRLGETTSSKFLGTTSDIACYAKILTGGILPMSVTLASDSIFQAFWADEKVDALLHGHSYTGHPIGCAVANKTMDILDKLEESGAFDQARSEWGIESADSTRRGWSFWSRQATEDLSRLDSVEGVISLGTVQAVHLRVADGGYASGAAANAIARLRAHRKGNDFDVHARPLGNVVYFMCSLNTPQEHLRSIEQSLLHVLA